MSGRSEHRGAIDVARVGALAFVVLGHLTLAVIDRTPEGDLRGANVLALHPGLAWLAMLSPMPVFFAAAGWANAHATPKVAAPRVRALVGLGAIVVGSWSAASMIELVVRGSGGIVGDGARIATQPIWFLAAYLPFSAAGARLSRLADRPVRVIVTALLVLACLDAARFAAGAPAAIGWPGFFVAWMVAWVLGAAWRHRYESDAAGRSEARVGLTLASAAVLGAAALVLFAGYFPSLIDAVPGERSNTTPPTLFTAVASMVQVGLLMVVARRLDGLARRHRRRLDRAGGVAVGVYLWHLTALALCAAVLAAGLWAPTRFSLAWWCSRPLWFAAVLGTTGGLVAVTAWVHSRLPVVHRTPPDGVTLAAGFLLATVGAAVTGMWGPRTPAGALVGSLGLAVGWWCLRGSGHDPHISTGTGTGTEAA